jgi:hypothetical protein
MIDFCNLVEDQKEHPWKYYQQMSDALNKTGRPILFNVIFCVVLTIIGL